MSHFKCRDPSVRTRNFASIVYPDSAPENWYARLQDSHVNACVSPLHIGQKEDGSPLKPHFHIVVMFDGVKSLKQADEFFRLIIGDGCKDCEQVQSLRGYLRYLCHLDEESNEKPHYDPEQVRVCGDIDYLSLIESDEDDTNALMDITFFIHNNHITNFIEFQCWNACNNREWFRVCSRSSTLYVTQLIKSEKYFNQDKEL